MRDLCSPRVETKLCEGPRSRRRVCLCVSGFVWLGVCEGVFHFPTNEVFLAVLLAWQYVPILKLTKLTSSHSY